MQIEILPHRQFAIERERLRHVADVAARLHVVGAHRLAEQLRRAFGRRQKPRQHFHGRDLPQPFEPRKPKISPRPMRKLTWSTAMKSPNRRVSPSASIAGVFVRAVRARRAR